MVRSERTSFVDERARLHGEERLLDVLCPLPVREKPVVNPFAALFGAAHSPEPTDNAAFESKLAAARARRREVREQLARGELEDQVVEIEVDDSSPGMIEVFSGGGMEELGVNLQDVLGGMLPRKKRRRKVPVHEARRILTAEEATKLIDMDEVTAEGIARAEQSGIVFLDEIDKIAAKGHGAGPDVSREGVQRDILPIVEGCTVQTKHGPVKTGHILFIAAGAFHMSRPSDLIPELQGRFPIRVELTSLTQADFVRILTEPKNALTRQYTALLSTEGVDLSFTPDGIDEIARIADDVNSSAENIGARRLHTILEKVLEDVAFSAPEASGAVVVGAAFVKERLAGVIARSDFSDYVL